MSGRALGLGVVGLLLLGQPTRAALSSAELRAIAATPAADARVPLSLALTDLQGRGTSLGAALGGRPALLMLADFRCTQLCGSILAIAAQALHATGLSPRADFTLAVVGFNPEASASDGGALKAEELGAFPDVAADARVLTGAPAEIGQLEQALGFSAVRDAAAQRFAHPADLYVLTTDGRVSRVLSGLALDPDALRLALVEAGGGRIGTLVDRLHVLCYGLDPLIGASTGLAQTMLRIGASLTMLGVGGLVIVAVRRRLRTGAA